MKLLEDRILKDGFVKDGNVLKVDKFLNHQMDIRLFEEMAKEWKRLYSGCEINKILTIEASGIGIASLVGREFDCPVVFAKKSQTKNIAGDVYTSKVQSFTHGKLYDVIVSKEMLGPEDKILIIDDFLAMGSALEGLINIVFDSKATLVGVGIAIEKAFQPGGEMIRNRGVRVESLAKIVSMNDKDGIVFA